MGHGYRAHAQAGVRITQPLSELAQKIPLYEEISTFYTVGDRTLNFRWFQVICDNTPYNQIFST
ncbi:hypothetical protein [Nodularia spumigena]|jgi:hypothetical protein|uniref:Uncharacterized protein n=1 Tax=Nodularia spumigena UHCC 0060 TaxID=3110300 RepID=A0ABU5UWH4_NODSP|nr:hypothetical protein [Nodularia spumigena UHCC 0060]